MAKPYQNAALICAILSVVAVVGIVAGLLTGNPLIPLLFLIPTIAYEVYRTEGASTKLASWGLLLVFIGVIVLLVFNISFDVAGWLGRSSMEVAGYDVPLGDISIVGPVIMAVLSVVLLVRTRGIYTKWLAVIVIIVSFVVIYLMDTAIFDTFLKFAVEEGVDSV